MDTRRTHYFAAYSARQVRQDLAASGRGVRSHHRRAPGPGGDFRPSHAAQSLRRAPAASIDGTLSYNRAQGERARSRLIAGLISSLQPSRGVRAPAEGCRELFAASWGHVLVPGRRFRYGRCRALAGRPFCHGDHGYPVAMEARPVRIFVAMPGSTMGDRARWGDIEEIKRRLLEPAAERFGQNLGRRAELVIEKDKLVTGPDSPLHVSRGGRC